MTHTDFSPRRSVDERFHDLIEQSVIWVWLLFWTMEAGMNARFGWRLVGGGVAGLPMGALLFGVAVWGAYLPMRCRDVPRTDPHRKRRRLVLGLLAALCFAVSQASGWANLGTMLADGATARNTKATEQATAADDVERLRKEQSGMTPPKRTVEAIEAALSLEKRRTSKAYPDGDGPAALALKQELANAKRYHALPGLIQAATERLEDAPQVAGGRPELDVLKRIFVGAGDKEIAFWIPPLLTFLIGIVATFGPVLIGLRIPGTRAASAAAAPAGHLPSGDIFDGFRGGNPFDPHGRAPESYAFRVAPGDTPAGSRPPVAWQSRGNNAFAQEGGGTPSHHASGTAPSGRLPWGQSEGATNIAGPPVSHVQPQPQASPAAASNAPITINVGGATSNGAPGSSPGVAATVGVPGRRMVRRPANEGLPAVSASHAPAVSPAAAERPVDRDRLNTVIDQLVTFAAAELVSDDGALVPFADMVERYRHWAQGRGIDPAAFAIMFPAATGIALIDIAGVQHFAGARLRQQLKVVGG